jgi:Zn-dependent peptidase ImmA (M78 family)
MRKKLAEHTYSARELKSNDDWSEWQANALAAALLMPRTQIEKLLMNGGDFTSGGDVPFCDYAAFSYLQDELFVSKSALKTRLRQLGIPCRSTDEYFFERSEKLRNAYIPDRTKLYNHARSYGANSVLP